ncbi:MAG: efflux RND transporter periplasmic adaptor subunit [Acidobacteriota bacterium]|nr:efflux RND transporter periplasmic adaptor subunit [Acidobacteriota bacterium]
MRKKITLLTIVALAYVAGYGYGRWYGKVPVAAAKSPRKILYWHDPMHPAYKSDKPGIAPDCNMALTAVYDDDPEIESGTPDRAPGTIRVPVEKQQLIGVKVEMAGLRPAFEVTRAPAKVGLDESKVYRIQTKLEGWFDEVYVSSAGTFVKKNQQLLTIYNPQSTPAQLEWVALMKAKMLDQKPDEGLIAQSRRKLELLGLSDEQIETIGKSRAPMYRMLIKSPIDGFVLERNAFPKQKVTPDTIYTIADLSKVWATADVFEYQAPPLVVGQNVILTVPYLPGRKFEGVVDTVLPVVDPASRTLKVRAVFANNDYALKPEMYGDMEFRSGGAARLTVPQDAVLDSGLHKTVFIDRGEGYFEPREVKTGKQYGDRVEIASGLKKGERVVVSGNFLLDSESQLKTGR